jgi:hypothetical protein
MSGTTVLLGQVPCEQCWPTLLPTSKHYFDPSEQEGPSGGAEISKDRAQPSEPAAEHVSTHGLADEIRGARLLRLEGVGGAATPSLGRGRISLRGKGERVFSPGG